MGQSSVSNTGTISNDPIPTMPIALPAPAIFRPTHSSSSTSKAFAWSDQANWSNGVAPNNNNIQSFVTIAPGAVGANVDDIASLTVAGLTFAPGAAALQIGAGATLTVASNVANGVIGLASNALLVELKSGLSYVNLVGSNARVAMGGVPQGYIVFSNTPGVDGSLFITQPQLHTATTAGTDSQYIQNFTLGDHIYIEEQQTHALTATYTPHNATYGTLLLSDGATPIYQFTNFQGSTTLNYVVSETTISDPISGVAKVPALDLTISTAPRTTTQPSSSPTSGSAGTAPATSGSTTGTTTTGSTTPTAPAAPTVTAPAIPQPVGPGQVVGLVLQNPGANSLAAREITFGQEFQAGQVPAGQQLVAMIGGVAVPVQMDVKTTNADGSVAMAILTMQQPTLAAGASTPVMLALAPAAATPPTPVDIGALASASSNYKLQVTLTLHNPDGSTTPVSIDAAQALGAALKSGHYSTWLSGPQATQVRIDVPVAGSLHVTMDITAYADGTTSTDVTFNNDIAMSASGGAVVYDATIMQNGAVAFQQNAITQYQYTSWDKTFASNGLPSVNVQHDIAALEKTGLIQNYDLSTGVSTSLITSESTQMGKAGFDSVLGTAGITQYMPAQGGRWDIGPTTQGNTIWLMTQNATAAQYALAQADAAGSIPWALYDAKSGTYLTSTAYPLLWADNRAKGTGGVTALTQDLPSTAQTGWTPDPAHEPDLDYVAYLMTGDRHFLDELNAEASYDIMTTRPTSSGGPMPSGRQGALGVVADGAGQVRAQAWNLREIVEAAAANPAGSAEKAYFTQIETNNFNNLLALAGRLTEGEASGWVPGAYTAGLMAPWQQDYLATSVALAAQQGNAAAVQFLGWETNFLAGRFLASGISPYMATAYNLSTDVAGQPENTSALQTWSAISTATLANGVDGPTVNTALSRAYAQGARAALAGEITVSEDPRAIQAFGWVTAYEQINNAYNQANPYLNIVPCLSDGSLLTGNNIIVTSDTISRVIQGSATADQLIYETGAANVTIQGGSGINILFAGTGSDTLIGGANNDYLFAGSGTDVLSGGAGTNYMRAGSGADTFLLDASQSAADTIADFKIGTDHLHALSGGSPLNAAAISGLLAGATSDGAGGSVLHLSGAHNVTLASVGVAQLSSGIFA